MRKIEVPTDTPTVFELGMQLLTYRGGGKRVEGGGTRTTEGEREEARMEETTQST